IDHLLLDALVRRAEGHDVLVRRPGQRARGEVSAAARDFRQEAARLVGDDEAQVDAEACRESLRELEFDASRGVRSVVEGSRTLGRDDPELAQFENLLEQRRRTSAASEQRGQGHEKERSHRSSSMTFLLWRQYTVNCVTRRGSVLVSRVTQRLSLKMRGRNEVSLGGDFASRLIM